MFKPASTFTSKQRPTLDWIDQILVSIFLIYNITILFYFESSYFLYRQKTDYDDDCCGQRQRNTAKEASGSRVYGDCDIFVRELLKNIIGQEELKSWEADRQTRLVNYDKRRRPSDN